MTFVIGIDGGGTKTEAILADLTGGIIAQAITGPTNPNLYSKEDLLKTFQLLFHELESQSPISFRQTTRLFAGISGVGNEQSKRTIYEVLFEILPKTIAIQIEPDPINALYSGTFGEPGIVQIAGTGSITYGINENGKHERIGGWGYLFGDEGSGFDIGRRAITAVLKAKDRRGEKTMLTELLLSRFSVSDEMELVQKIYGSAIPKNEISPLSIEVFEAYKRGDSIAAEIVCVVVKEIADNIRALYNKLFHSKGEVNVVLCGGVFSDKGVLPPLLQKELLDQHKLTLIYPILKPVAGSVIGAYMINEASMNSETIRKLSGKLKEGEKSCPL